MRKERDCVLGCRGVGTGQYSGEVGRGEEKKADVWLFTVKKQVLFLEQKRGGK